MKKHLFKLVAMLVLFVFFCAGARAADLPDLLKFSNGIATLNASNAGPTWFSWTYKGGKEMQEVFLEYVDLLGTRKDLKLRGMLAPKDSNIIEMCWYDYIGKGGVSSTRLTIKSIDWAEDFNVYIRCTKNNGEYFITLYAAKEFKLVDSGERASVKAETPTIKPTKKPTAKPTAKVTAKPTQKPTAKPTVKPTVKPADNKEDGSASDSGGSNGHWEWQWQWIDVWEYDRNGRPELVRKNEKVQVWVED